MRMPSRNEIERLRKEYPEGTEIIVNHIEDPYSTVKRGTTGKVIHVDDIGQIHWTGSGLALIPGVDSFHKKG